MRCSCVHYFSHSAVTLYKHGIKIYCHPKEDIWETNQKAGCRTKLLSGCCEQKLLTQTPLQQLSGRQESRDMMQVFWVFFFQKCLHILRVNKNFTCVTTLFNIAAIWAISGHAHIGKENTELCHRGTCEFELLTELTFEPSDLIRSSSQMWYGSQ